MTTTTPLSIPPELKKITQYIRRAEELDRDRTYPESRLVAYYLRQYAAQLGIGSINNTGAGGSTQVKQCLSDILNNLEGEKKAMNNFSKKEAQFLCRGFADRVLDKANEQDLAVVESIRSNQSETTSLDSTMQQVFKDIAQAFYAAGTFYDILQQFYDSATNNNNEENKEEERQEENKRRLYCKFKATNILKALKEGRIPTSQEETETEMHVPQVQLRQVSGSESDSRESTHKIYVPSPISAPPLPPTDMLMFPPVSYQSQVPAAPPAAVSTTTPPAWTSMDSTPLIPVPIVLSDSTTQYIEESLPIPPSNRVLESRRPSSNLESTSGLLVNNSKGKPVSKAQLSDARELTQFAMAALENKDADLAAERLQSALEALGRR